MFTLWLGGEKINDDGDRTKMCYITTIVFPSSTGSHWPNKLSSLGAASPWSIHPVHNSFPTMLVIFSIFHSTCQFFSPISWRNADVLLCCSTHAFFSWSLIHLLTHSLTIPYAQTGTRFRARWRNHLAKWHWSVCCSSRTNIFHSPINVLCRFSNNKNPSRTIVEKPPSKIWLISTRTAAAMTMSQCENISPVRTENYWS